MEKQLQVTDSFQLESPSYPCSELNEMSTEETSGDERELNVTSRGKKWGNNDSNNNYKHSSFSNTCSYNYKNNRTDLKTTDKASSGNKDQMTP